MIKIIIMLGAIGVAALAYYVLIDASKNIEDEQQEDEIWW